MLKFVLRSLLLVALVLPKTYAQEPAAASQMAFSELIAQAEYYLGEGKSMEAIPLLKEIITRSITMSGSEESVQSARLLLASAYSKQQRWKEARSYIEEYLSKTPVNDRTAALQILCSIALAEQNWTELNQTAQALREQKGLSVRKREEVEQFYVQALYNGGAYDKALEVLPNVISQTKDPEKARAYRIMQLNCLSKSGQVQKMVSDLPFLFRGDARNDVTLNLTLLGIADDLFDRNQYRQALSIYRLVMPKAPLVEWNTKKIEEQKAKGQIKSDDEEAKAEAAEKLAELDKALEFLKSVPDYDVHVSYRAAQIYSENSRYWEAVSIFDKVYEENAETEQGKSAYLQKVLLLFEVGAGEEAVAESISYLEKNRSGLYPRIICTALLDYYLRQEKLSEALSLESRFVERWTRAADKLERDQEASLRYLFSFVHFRQGNYEEARLAFERVKKMSPESDEAINSHYWAAMCYLLQKKYDVAYDQFVNYREKWPRADFSATALFRAGVCRFGAEDYDGALAIFKAFIVNYEKDALMPEALSMYGDLLAADGEIDGALESYERVVALVLSNYKNTTDATLKKQITAPATYATMQSAQALQTDADFQKDVALSEANYRKIISKVQDYMKTFGDDADWAQGVFWIGKAQLALGETDQAVAAYLDVVIKYGVDPSQEGVASIVLDLAEIIKTQLSLPKSEKAMASIQKARSETSSLTLQILLDVLVAEIKGTQLELGRTLLAQEKDLSVIPPSGLSLMCTILFTQGDFYRAEEFFKYFAEHYDGSLFMISAYRLRIADLYRQKKYDEAYILVKQALDLYGATEDTGWVPLMKGNIEFAQGKYKEAEKTYTEIFGERVWRGAVSAEAMLQIAEAWYAQENYEKAFAFFQRTYLLYKAYDGGRWAAEGYLRSANCLMKLGKTNDVKNTYRAMLQDEYVRNLPQTAEAKKALGPEETARIISGKTNTVKQVKGEGTP